MSSQRHAFSRDDKLRRVVLTPENIWLISQIKENVMTLEERVRYEAMAVIVRALAHPTRLFLVAELAQQERCVCELAHMVGSDISTVSKHLSILKNAGILSDQKRGTLVFYRLETPCILEVLSCIEIVLAERLKKQEQLISSLKGYPHEMA